MRQISLETLVNALVKYCDKKYKFISISGNGGAGKTFFSISIVNEIRKRDKNANCISMDDFIVDTKLRKNSITTWKENDKDIEGSYTSCVKGSYFLRAVETSIYSLKSGLDCFIKPKRQEMRLLNAKDSITILEGIGSAFLENDDNMLKIFIECDEDVEINRRIARDGEKYTTDEIRKDFIKRNSQFIANVIPYKDEHNLVLKSNEDFSYTIIRDDFNIIENK